MKSEKTVQSPYPDPISPRCDKSVLGHVDYDPFKLMPQQLPSHPRVFLSAAQLERVRAELKTVAWRASALKQLQADCLNEEPLPTAVSAQSNPTRNRALVPQAFRHALASLLTEDDELLQGAKARLLAFCRAAQTGPGQEDVWPPAGSLNESHFIKYLGFSYDLLAAGGLSEEEDACFRAVLDISASKGSHHTTCGNHNTWSIAGRLSVALARGDRQGIHDALYGCPYGEHWRYGLIHQLRHDALADGAHWEGTTGYHMYTLMALAQCVRMLENSGVDLWHKPLPQQQQNDGSDTHRWYGPSGEKTIKCLFDAPLYMAGSNGDFSLLHDSGLRNLRGLYVWGVVYSLAYDAYQDPAYAALLQRMEAENPPQSRKYPDLPMPLSTHQGLTDFARIHCRDWSNASFSYRTDHTIGITGDHRHGSTLFPQLGMAVMRAQPDNREGFNAFLRWGPHVAGHMNPAALHLDIVAGNRQLTDAPRTGGYADKMHLTWARTTVAANTVTVDRQSMFPYDFATESIWECDQWRDRVSDGSLVSFQPEPSVRAVRAINRTVYPGVLLDRTVVVQPEYLLDLYQVSSEQDHGYDWVIHGVGQVDNPAVPLPDESGRGYQHLTRLRCLADTAAARQQTVDFENGASRLQVLLPEGAQLLLADDPPPKQPGTGDKAVIGEMDRVILPRTAVMVRLRSANACFVSLWSDDRAADIRLLDQRLMPDGTCEIRLTCNGQTRTWSVAALQDGALQKSVRCGQ